MVKDKTTTTLEVDVIGAFSNLLRVQDELMHAADMFEKGKRLGEHWCIEIDTADTEETLKHIHSNVKKSIERLKGYVLFVGVRTVGGIPYHDTHCFFEQGVQSVSFVKKGKLKGWLLFRDMLEALGYEVKTDKTMHVTVVNE